MFAIDLSFHVVMSVVVFYITTAIMAYLYNHAFYTVKIILYKIPLNPLITRYTPITVRRIYLIRPKTVGCMLHDQRYINAMTAYNWVYSSRCMDK
jgi:hypothetical protein